MAAAAKAIEADGGLGVLVNNVGTEGRLAERERRRGPGSPGR